jgi:hypothetical protein
MPLDNVLFIFAKSATSLQLASYAIASNSAPPRRPSSNMADADDVGTIAGQVKSMFRFGSGKVATVYRHLADLSCRTLADDDDRLVADFASCYGFADPEWELPECDSP